MPDRIVEPSLEDGQESARPTRFRVLVCGGRDYREEWRIFKELWKLYHAHDNALVVIEGGARGADAAAALWAEAWCRDLDVEHLQFKAKWHEHGKSAGPRRNAQMLSEGCPDLVLAFPGGNGTEHMVALADKAGVPVRRCR